VVVNEALKMLRNMRKIYLEKSADEFIRFEVLEKNILEPENSLL
jgi:hypothetical protein